MKPTSRIPLCLLVLAAFVPSLARAAADPIARIKAKGELTIGMQPGFVPFEMKKPDGGWVGFEVDMARAFAKELGVKARFVDMKWEGIIPALLANRFDVIISGMTITPERARAVLFSQGYYRSGQAILIGKKLMGKVSRPEELDKPGMSIVVQMGTTGDFLAGKTFHQAAIRKMDSETDSADSVLLGRADAFVFDEPYLRIFAQRYPGKVALLPSLMNTENFGLAARKADAPLVAAFNRFLDKWKSSGGYEKARKFFFIDLGWRKDFPSLF